MFRQLRITYLLESTTLWGGTKVAFEQAEALAEYGHHVNILSKDSSPEWYPLKLPVIQVSEFNSETIPVSDIIVGTYWTTVKSAYNCGRGKLVHLCQGYEGDYIEISYLKKDIDKVYHFDIPKLTISKHLNDFLKDRFNTETYYIGQMINRDIFYPKDKSLHRKILRRFRLSPLKILVVGPFQVDFKNIATALRGVSLAESRHKIPIELIRVSQFPLTKEEEAIRRPDRYYHHIAHNEMGNIYRQSDIFISVSKEAEGFGLPALEAMSCGIPTILSTISSYLNFDDVRDYSLFIDPLDYEALAEAIYKLSRDKDLTNKLTVRGLDISKNFTKDEVVKRLNEAFFTILGDDKFSKTKDFWNRYHLNRKSEVYMHWWDSPVVIEHCQKLITGNPTTNIYDFLKKEISTLPLQKGLSICSGSGDFERGLIDNNICAQIDAYEIAEERVREGIKISTEKGYHINFFIEDVNKANFKEDYYDLFISWSALHHIEKLEDVCRNVHQALKKGGFLLIQEYIGPNQLQWTDKQLDIINKILNILPQRLKRTPRTGEIIKKIERPSLDYMQSTDPSEAIRARDIIPVIKSFFELKTIKYFGGSIFNPLFNEIIGNFDHNNENDTTLIKSILLLEQTLIENKILEDNYVLIIASK